MHWGMWATGNKGPAHPLCPRAVRRQGACKQPGTPPGGPEGPNKSVSTQLGALVDATAVPGSTMTGMAVTADQ